MSISLKWLGPQFPDLANLKPLNAGGQKEVFSADHKSDGAVVLKIIHPHQGVESVEREILAVRQVQSDRVPKILEWGQITTPLGQCFWFREQQVVGQTCREALTKKAFTAVEVIRLGLHSLEALVRAESVKIVHRDVKPDNIMRDGSGNFWLLDFGIARHLELQSLTPTASRYGKFTLGYAPPEQFRNMKREIDARCDLFGLGVTLLECATQRNPFRHGASNELEIIKRVEQLALPRLQLSCTAADELADLVAATTQKRKEHRPFTANEACEWMREIATKNGVK